MYYVGQLHDIRHGCVYTSIEEARKEIHRNLQTGQMMLFTNLPKSKDYYIVGTIGEFADTRMNKIFIDLDDKKALDEAKSHLAMLQTRGWPNKQLAFKKLDIVTKGPADPDVRTQEHLDLERRMAKLLHALERGVLVTNRTGATMELLLIEDDPNTSRLIYNHGQYAVMEIGGWETIDPVEIFSILRNLRALCGEIRIVDPDSQPRKWARLQHQANELWSTPLRLPDFELTADELTPQETPDDSQDIHLDSDDTTHALRSNGTSEESS